MTVLPRGAKNRRSGRRPGWLLLTALLVLAILASATLVFTNRVELLRLAVILSLWAAVLAAFVSVIYRRQSQLDAAKARDMKYVYDLQLDREISARREYELSVEAHLRRQLAGELRAQATDEMAALRAELGALRANLQALLGTDLGDLPALESDRIAEPVLAQPMPMPPGRVESSRVTPVAAIADVAQFTQIEVTRVEVAEEVAEEVAAPVDTPIIDVPEEPLTPAAPQASPRRERPQAGGYPPPQPAEGYRGSHRRAEDGRSRAQRPAQPPPPRPAQPPLQQPPGTPPPRPPVPAAPPLRPPPPPAPPSPWRPPAAPSTPWRPPETRSRPGRHRGFDEQTPQPAPAGRHWSNTAGDDGGPAGRHRTDQAAAPQSAAENTPDEPQGQHAGGAPVADLVARLRANEAAGGPSGGGRRRRGD